MKRILGVCLCILAGIANANETITVAATKIPQAEILEFVKPSLEKQGYNLKIIVYNNYQAQPLLSTPGAAGFNPNDEVYFKHADANFFQHQPYLDNYNLLHKKGKLVAVAKVFSAPLGLYANPETEADFIQSKKISDLSKAVVGIPDDQVNDARALLFLQDQGLIKLKPNKQGFYTRRDIIKNPYNLKVVEADPSVLAGMLKAKKLNVAVINSSMAYQSDLDVAKESVFLEKLDPRYVNIVAVRPELASSPKIKALVQALESPEVKEFIETKYNGAIVPAF